MMARRVALKVRCLDHDGRGCVADHPKIGRTPHARVCERLCPRRRASEDGPPVDWIIVDDPPPPPFDGSHIWAEWYGRANRFAGDAAAERDWIKSMVANLPCGECRDHAQTILAESPPDPRSKLTYFDSVASYHNAVNRRKNAREWSRDEVRLRWMK